ncbi:MAG: hypothetical protein ACYCZF_13645 [Anaerolineae bacterium]
MSAAMTAPVKVKPGRREKAERATLYEEAGFPASLARIEVEIAAELIRHHIRQRGGSILLVDALSWLEKVSVFIEEWRLADIERTQYPYQRETNRG